MVRYCNILASYVEASSFCFCVCAYSQNRDGGGAPWDPHPQLQYPPPPKFPDIKGISKVSSKGVVVRLYIASVFMHIFTCG